MNSSVAPYNDHTFQMELSFIAQSDMRDEEKKRVGLACVDVLSKYAVVIPIESRELADVIAGAMEVLNKMKGGGGDPKIIYTDDERSIAGKDFQELLKAERLNCIELVVIPLLSRDLFALSRICFSRGLKPMKKGIKRIFNGQTTYVR